MPKKSQNEQSLVGARLKAFRKLAESHGVTMTALAEALGKSSASSYQHYEDRFKGTELPLWVAKALAPVFESKGISPAPLYELAGVSHKFDAVTPRPVKDSDTPPPQTEGGNEEGELTDEERILLKNYRDLDDATKAKQFRKLTILGEQAREQKTSFSQRS